MSLYKNKFAEHKNIADKTKDFVTARKNGGFAVGADGKTVPLTDVKFENVEFICGLWRIQESFPHTTQKVRDIEVVLAEKLTHTERIPFEYWRAYRIGENCYGRYLFAKPDVIVAKYETDNGTYWGYGNTIEQARAFLGIKLFDEHMDLIHAAACRNARNNQKK